MEDIHLITEKDVMKNLVSLLGKLCITIKVSTVFLNQFVLILSILRKCS